MKSRYLIPIIGIAIMLYDQRHTGSDEELLLATSLIHALYMLILLFIYLIFIIC